MTALHTVLKSTLVAAAASLALSACDRGGSDDTVSTTGSTGSRTADTTAGSSADSVAAPGGTTSGTGMAGGGPGTGANTGSTGTDVAAAPPSAVTGRTDTAAGGTTPQSPDATLNSNPPAAGSSGSEPASASLAEADRKFVETAAASGLYEVAVAKLAADKAQDPAIKSYAAMLVDHHTAANAKLKQVASSRQVELPASFPADKQRVIDKLSKASGAAFDREFVQTVGIKDHKTDIALFERASRTAKDPEVKSFATETLPTLRDHLAQAQKLPAKKS